MNAITLAAQTLLSGFTEALRILYEAGREGWRGRLGHLHFFTGGLALRYWPALGDDQPTLQLELPGLKLSLKLGAVVRRSERDWDSYAGFSCGREGVYVGWFGRSTILYWPWSLRYVRTEDAVRWGQFMGYTWTPTPKGDYEHKLAARWTASYSYVRDNGQVQTTLATYRVCRRFYVYRALRWLGWPLRVYYSLDVDFAAPIGEGVHSWKGGTTGAGINIAPTESPHEALRRMEATRRFT